MQDGELLAHDPADTGQGLDDRGQPRKSCDELADPRLVSTATDDAYFQTKIAQRAAQIVRRTSLVGKHESYEADLVVHAAGRVPDLDTLDLAAAGVERDKRRLKINEFLQSTSNPAVYAAGRGKRHEL